MKTLAVRKSNDSEHSVRRMRISDTVYNPPFGSDFPDKRSHVVIRNQITEALFDINIDLIKQIMLITRIFTYSSILAFKHQ